MFNEKQPKDYVLVQSEFLSNMQTLVSIRMEDGWRPVGGIAYGKGDEGGEKDGVWVQAMVLYDQ